MAKLSCKNPATGELLKEVDLTPIEALPAVFERARAAQILWASVPPKKRAQRLLQLREAVLHHADDLILLIANENGKPRFEALAAEVLPSVETLTHFAKRCPSLLKDQPLPLRLMRHRQSILNYWPLGNVLILAPWNYPFMIPFTDIFMALMAGNAVVFKPSEYASLIGLKIQQICEESGLPPDIVQTVVGDGTLGAALIQQKPAKIFFTGSASTGRKVMTAAAEHLIPVNLELGGKNPLIVLPDANLDLATSAALWGAFSNSGQVCAATSRVLVHESIIDRFEKQLLEKLATLRQGPSLGFENDLGAITMEGQKAVYVSQLKEAREKGATILCGGEFSDDRAYLRPTVIRGGNLAESRVYTEESFGPILTLTPFRSPAQAVEMANNTRYGLTASIISKNLGLAEDIARQLHVGTAMINEVLYTAGLGETPWGGVKESGFGRTRSDLGFYEFVNVRHIHRPRSRLFSFKSLWWFPYSPYQFQAFRNFLELYRKHWTDKLKAFPHFLLNFVNFLKKERRL